MRERYNTGLKGQNTLTVLRNIHGQLSDGMWENVERLWKYWHFIDFYFDPETDEEIWMEISNTDWFEDTSNGDILMLYADCITYMVQYFIELRTRDGDTTEDFSDVRCDPLSLDDHRIRMKDDITCKFCLDIAGKIRENVSGRV